MPNGERSRDPEGETRPGAIDAVDRRTVLGGIAGAGGAFLAGCTGDGGGGGSTSLRLVTTTLSDLTSAELNPFSPARDFGITGLTNFLAWNNSPTHGPDGRYLEGLKDLTFDTDANEYVYELRDGIKWHKGTETVDDFTVEDMVLNWEMSTHPDLTAASTAAVNELVVEDDKTLVVKLEDTYHTESLRANPPLGRGIGAGTYRNGELASLFEELQAANEDGDDEGAKSAAQNIINHKIPTDGSKPISGPYMIESADKQRLEFKRVPGHPLTEDEPWNNNWEKTVLEVSTGSGTAVYQAAVSDQIDLGGGPYPSDLTAEDLPDHLTVPVFRGTQSRGFMINYKNNVPEVMKVEQGTPAPITSAKIRQAFAYAMNVEQQYANNEGKLFQDYVAFPDRMYTGDANLLKEAYPDLWENLPKYGLTPKPDKAKQRLEEAGLSQEGDKWVQPNGKTFSVKIPTWEFDSGMASRMANDLKNVGVKADVTIEEPGAHVGRIREGAVGFTTAFTRTAINAPDVESNLMLSTTGNAWAWAQHNPPGKYEIPPVGELEGDASMTYDADAATEKIRSSSMSEHAEVGKRAIWTYAYHLPKIDTYPVMGNSVLNEKRFEWPTDNEGVFQVTKDHPHYMAQIQVGMWAYQRGAPGQRAKDS